MNAWQRRLKLQLGWSEGMCDGCENDGNEFDQQKGMGREVLPSFNAFAAFLLCHSISFLSLCRTNSSTMLIGFCSVSPSEPVALASLSVCYLPTFGIHKLPFCRRVWASRFVDLGFLYTTSADDLNCKGHGHDVALLIHGHRFFPIVKQTVLIRLVLFLPRFGCAHKMGNDPITFCRFFVFPTHLALPLQKKFAFVSLSTFIYPFQAFALCSNKQLKKVLYSHLPSVVAHLST